MDRSSRSVPTGPGSRGGRWHEPEYRIAYHRAWRAAHPEYRERERLRTARRRAIQRGDDPSLVTEVARLPASIEQLQPPAVRCACSCGCREPVVTICGFCREGMH